jgi:rhamnosyltransferase
MTHPERQDRIGAVIVSFQPDLSQLTRLVSTLLAQVETVVVIDNSEPAIEPDVLLGMGKQLHLVQPGRNIGVAAAINLGVQELIKLDHQYAVLFDQDSLPPPGMTSTLKDQLLRLGADGRSVAAIGPSIRERGSAQATPFIRFRLPLNQRLRQDQGSIACDFLITSGKLLNLEHWATIGPMREAWFIDNIDLEWSFRARRLNFELHGSFDTELAHSIGEQKTLIPALPWPRYRHHGTHRLYTMMRNRVFLYRSQAPMAWIIQDLLRTAGKLMLFSLIRPRRANLAAMLRGLRDGWKTRPVP